MVKHKRSGAPAKREVAESGSLVHLCFSSPFFCLNTHSGPLSFLLGQENACSFTHIHRLVQRIFLHGPLLVLQDTSVPTSAQEAWLLCNERVAWERPRQGRVRVITSSSLFLNLFASRSLASFPWISHSAYLHMSLCGFLSFQMTPGAIHSPVHSDWVSFLL
jgi:hypothetical protein